MRPVRGTDAHKTEQLAELVCSNSFRSDDAETNAVGVLHAEMRLAGSLIMACADAHQVPAGGALAVDREGFSQAVTAKLEAHPLITIEREEVTGLPPEDWGTTIVATGPLTAPTLAEAIQAQTGADALAFFDAIAPIIHFDSINMDVCWFSRAMTRLGRAAPVRTTSTALWTRSSMRLSLLPSSKATRPISRNGKARPISMAVCLSK